MGERPIGLTPEQMGERQPIKLTSAEHKLLANTRDLNDQQLLALMNEKGIEFNSGMVKVECDDGKVREMNTSKEDFGTLKMLEEDEVIPSGVK